MGWFREGAVYLQPTTNTIKGLLKEGLTEEAASKIAGTVMGGGQEVVAQSGKMIGGQIAKGFNSFSSFKRVYGSAGEGQAWHHIVEQNPSNISKFGNQAIHNTENLIPLEHGAGTIHAKVSGYYSSKQFFTGGKTVRQWQSGQSYEAQYKFGIQKLKDFGWKP